VVDNQTTVLKCYQCADSYIITTSNKCLSKGALHTNCSVAIDENKCESC